MKASKPEEAIVCLLDELNHITRNADPRTVLESPITDALLNKLKELTTVLELKSSISIDSKLHSSLVRSLLRFTEFHDTLITLQIIGSLISVRFAQFNRVSVEMLMSLNVI